MLFQFLFSSKIFVSMDNSSSVTKIKLLFNSVVLKKICSFSCIECS